jgi:hypothetical protein
MNLSPEPDRPAFLGHPRRQVFVQDRNTSLLLLHRDVWTDQRTQARDFHTTVDAMVYCLTQQMRNVQIVVTFNWPGVPDVTMPVDAPQLPAAA